MLVIKIVCFVILLLLLVYHTIRTQPIENVDITIDENSKVGGTIQDIENEIDKTPAKETKLEIESIHPKRKQGWCYVGTDRGHRSCLQVGVNDFCHSQHIYPTREVCIHPNLRF